MAQQSARQPQRSVWRRVRSLAAAFLMLLVLCALTPGTSTGRPVDAHSLSAAPTTQSACAQQQATVAELIGIERGAQLVGESEGLPIDEITAMLRACWQEYQGQMPAAEKSCALFKQLAPLVFGWSRQVQLLGLEAEFAGEQAQVLPWAVRGLVNCHGEAFDKCVDQNDPTQAAEMVAIERQLDLLGALDQIDRTKLDHCLRFELVFTSTIDRDGLTGVTHTHSLVRATVPLRLTGELKLAGEAPLEYLEFTMRWPDGDSCTATVNSFRGSTATVPMFSYEVKERPD